jgi:hypothetical protein
MRRVWLGGGVSVIVATVIAAMLGGGPVTCNRTASTATFTAQLAAATAGQTLCLTAGAYTDFPKKDSESPGVTIRPAEGVARENVRITIAWNHPATSADWVTFDDVAITASTMSAPATNITFRDVEFVAAINIDTSGGIYCGTCPAMDEANILIEGSDFTESDCPAATCHLNHGRLVIFGPDVNDAAITVRDNHFFGGVCGDGIQIGGQGGNGVLIQGNLFDNMLQSSCDALVAVEPPHIDPLQGVGSTGWIFEDNYIRNSSTGVVNYDGSSSNTIVRNNVIEANGDAVCLGNMTDGTVEHNTIISGNIILCENHGHDPSTNVTWRDNIMAHNFDRIEGGSTFAVNDYNLCITGTCDGAHTINGQPPVWVDGATPTNFAGFTLAPGSPGRSVASDGTNIGVNP